MTDRAHARNTDPETSHEAADFATLGIQTARTMVERFAYKQGPAGFVDAQMSDQFGDTGSTLRTRRSELTSQNIILDSGRVAKYGESDRNRIVWVHRDFVPNAPPRLDEVAAPAKNEHRQEALAMAAEFEGYGRSFRAEGRAAISERCAAVAALLRSLAR